MGELQVWNISDNSLLFAKTIGYDTLFQLTGHPMENRSLRLPGQYIPRIKRWDGKACL